jgi:hypothetical protein
VIGLGVGLTTSVPAVKSDGASGTEKDNYLQKGVRGLKALRESFESDKVRTVSISFVLVLLLLQLPHHSDRISPSLAVVCFLLAIGLTAWSCSLFSNRTCSVAWAYLDQY